VLGLKELPRPSHVADALGLAATGMARVTGRFPSSATQKWPPHSPTRPLIARGAGPQP
jgi:hypothetical protein